MIRTRLSLQAYTPSLSSPEGLLSYSINDCLKYFAKAGGCYKTKAIKYVIDITKK